MDRAGILKMAMELTVKSRQEQYGDAEENFSVVARFWEVYSGHSYSASDVAMMLALLKVARAMSGYKEDNYVDLAGYAALAGEIAENEIKVNERRQGV